MKTILIIFLVFTLLAGIAGLTVWRYQVSVTDRETATETLLRPYFDEVLRDDLTGAYDNFTNDYYKSNFALDDYLAAHEKTFTENGKLVGYEISGFRECGSVFAARTIVCPSVNLKFERGAARVLEYHLEQGKDDKFRIRFSGKKIGSGGNIDGFPF